MSVPKAIGWILGTIKSAGLVRLIRLTRLKKNCNRPIYMLYLDVIYSVKTIIARGAFTFLWTMFNILRTSKKVWQKVIIDELDEDEKWEMAAP